jgi:hypothetical protein
LPIASFHSFPGRFVTPGVIFVTPVYATSLPE